MAKTTLTRKIGMGFLALVVLYLVGYFLFLDFIVEYLWFDSMDYSGYFWLRFFYKFLIAGGITILFFLMFFTHFWIASRYLGAEAFDLDKDSNTLIQKLRTGAMEVYTPLSLLLAIIVAIPFYTQWESALLFLFAPEAGVSESVYGNDISFYLFSLPIFKIIQKELLVTSILLFAGVAFLYFLEQRILSERGKKLPMGSVIHRILLIGFVCAWVVWGFLLQRFNLLYTDAHEPLFYGPGWVEMRYHLPLIWVAIVSFIITAYAAIIIVLTDGKRGTKVLLASLVVLALSVALRVIPAIPSMINEYVVVPNQLRFEAPFIDNNIKATLNAYKLDQAKSVKLPLSSSSYADLARGIKQEFSHNIPLWDKVYLDDVYNQLQAITPYYRFISIDEDRYTINGTLHQVNLGAREIDLTKLPKASHTWQNIHLRYTHGYGFAMTPAAQEADKPMQWYARDLTLTSPVGISVERPDIYYGQQPQYPYVIVPNDLDVAGIPSTMGADPNKHVHLGEGGIHIGSVWRKLVFSVYFGDPLIFMSTDLNPASRLRMRRNITKRVHMLAPELVLDDDPYLVAAEKDLYWIQDAYTFSEYYPISKPSVALVRTADGAEQKRFNYTRNSVKIAINAYDGVVRFYVSDPSDPIIQAYMRAYPGVFKSIDQLPEKLKSHLRYPEDFFKHQLQIFARYHQTDPSVFYQQAETWSLANLEDKPMPPYYLTTNLNIPGCSESTQFMQIGVMTWVNRTNLSALLIGGSPDGNSCSDGSILQNLISLELPKELQVNGPAQVSALIHQDPAISGKFTLWNQQGSTVELGHMIILPVSHTMLYIQPVYLLAEKNSIPQLVRVIVSAADEVVMDVSLKKAFDQLLAKLKTH